MKALFAAAAVLVVAAPAVAQPDPNAQTRPDVVTNSGPQERDARGIPVMNMAPNIPAGANQTVNIPQGAQVRIVPASEVFQTRPAAAEYPACTRGQTDRCVQAYEVGRRPRR